jgi:predicted lipoprotein with Yx(FWY)xxD motif
MNSRTASGVRMRRNGGMEMLQKCFLILTGILLVAGNVIGADLKMPAEVQARKSDAGSVVLADAKGMTLYTFDMDTVPGKSTCNPDNKCSIYWPALAAPGDAKPVGAWTVVTRDDGSKQWAYRGKPLYTFANDKIAGETSGNDKGPNGSHIWHCALP